MYEEQEFRRGRDGSSQGPPGLMERAGVPQADHALLGQWGQEGRGHLF